MAREKALRLALYDWNGQVEVATDGDAQLFSYTDAGEVEISRGEGRTYIHLGQTGGEVVVRISASGLEPASLTVSPRR